MLDAAGMVPRGREAAIGMALVDGQLVAWMKRTLGKDRVDFALTPLRDWSPTRSTPCTRRRSATARSSASRTAKS